MDLIFALGMHDDQHFPSQHAERHPARFALVQPVILESESRASKYPFGVGEVQAAALAGDLALGFVPSEAHDPIMQIIMRMSMHIQPMKTDCFLFFSFPPAQFTFLVCRADVPVRPPSLTHIAQVRGGRTIKNLVNAELRPGIA